MNNDHQGLYPQWDDNARRRAQTLRKKLNPSINQEKFYRLCVEAQMSRGYALDLFSEDTRLKRKILFDSGCSVLYSGRDEKGLAQVIGVYSASDGRINAAFKRIFESAEEKYGRKPTIAEKPKGRPVSQEEAGALFAKIKETLKV